MKNQMELQRSLQVIHEFNTHPIVARNIQNLNGMLE